MKDKRVPSEVIDTGLFQMEQLGVLTDWQGPNYAGELGRRSWNITYADGTGDILSPGECMCLIRGSQDTMKVLVGR